MGNFFFLSDHTQQLLDTKRLTFLLAPLSNKSKLEFQMIKYPWCQVEICKQKNLQGLHKLGHSRPHCETEEKKI
jgi:hypothetical protein